MIVEPQIHIAKPEGPEEKVKKVIVAVHGVGDQYSFSTLQSVVNQFCRFFGEPTAIPLGCFHDDRISFSLKPPYPHEKLKSISFAEVYWAKIPREVISDQHTLEEAKKWANTIVERLRLRWKQAKVSGSQSRFNDSYTESDFTLLKLVLIEMIETISVLERLCLISERAGLFTFDLGKLLNDYLGDVQIVTEFEKQRLKILQAFRCVLENVYKEYPEAEIHLVAHSEGTVVSFLGLLEAIREPSKFLWVKNVRSFMTIGSPLDTHLILWPELFDSPLPAQWSQFSKKIEWRNYYDYADPIAFKLDDIRDWIGKSDFKTVFNFELKHDIGFNRSPFPGKAHVDYWNDNDIFDHYIKDVVDKSEEVVVPPKTINWKRWVSLSIPPVIVVSLLLIAVYIMLNSIFNYIDPSHDIYRFRDDLFLLKTVTGTSLLLLGVTIVSRIPRLTNNMRLRIMAWLLYFSFAFFYFIVIPDSNVDRGEIKEWLASSFNIFVPSGWIRFTISTIILFVIYFVNKEWPSLGVKPLIIIGTITILFIILYHILNTKNNIEGAISTDVALWPVILAISVFFYLWWLAALIFDLMFVWYLYIRHSKALENMDEIIGSSARDYNKNNFVT
ncbi:hypothetical protein [Telluribacter sp.]|jgi:pimeloyl-ACP methyl ester carboxylesterase|uniref:hypothetical protein n=1 Tax=Telluribacter sp. TaxID=1978767 RepID=UPI002E152604|nr:hypothetical protein [Telluribacter sp.]